MRHQNNWKFTNEAFCQHITFTAIHYLYKHIRSSICMCINVFMACNLLSVPVQINTHNGVIVAVTKNHLRIQNICLRVYDGGRKNVGRTVRHVKCVCVCVGDIIVFRFNTHGPRWRPQPNTHNNNNNPIDSYPYTHETSGIIIFMIDWIRYDSISFWLNRLTSNFGRSTRLPSFHLFVLYINVFVTRNRNNVANKSVYEHTWSHQCVRSVL